MGVEELAMVMDLARQVGIFLARRLKHHLSPASRQHLSPSPCNLSISQSPPVEPYLGAIGEFVRCEVHLAKGTLPD